LKPKWQGIFFNTGSVHGIRFAAPNEKSAQFGTVQPFLRLNPCYVPVIPSKKLCTNFCDDKVILKHSNNCLSKATFVSIESGQECRTERCLLLELVELISDISRRLAWMFQTIIKLEKNKKNLNFYGYMPGKSVNWRKLVPVSSHQSCTPRAGRKFLLHPSCHLMFHKYY